LDYLYYAHWQDIFITFLTFIRATFDLIFFLSSFGLDLFPHALLTWETGLSVLMDFFFLSFSLSMIASPILSPRLDLLSCNLTVYIFKNEKGYQIKKYLHRMKHKLKYE
jgi:hypothetical protein